MDYYHLPPSPLNKIESEAYKNFINSVDSEATKKSYMVGLSLFMKYCKIEEGDYDSVLMQSLHQNKLEDKIRDYIIYLKVVKQLSSNSVNLYMAAIAHFYSMNNVVLNWRRLSKFKGKKRMKVEDKPYSKEQIRQLLDFSDLRTKCMILLMCSAGLRRGALPGLTVGDLEKKEIDQNLSIYKISVYKKEQEAYFTFCTPECTKLLDQYFDFRERLGEKIHSKSLVFRKGFNSLNVQKPEPLGVDSISWIMNTLLDRSGIRPRQEKISEVGGIEGPADRTSIMQCHGFRKFFETTSRLAGMDLLLINRCMGHSSGLEDSYLKLSEDQILEGNDKMIGYIGAIDDLTINEEHRLRRKVEVLVEKRNEIQVMKESHEQEMKAMRQEMENKFRQILTKIDPGKLG
jgi:integrase